MKSNLKIISIFLIMIGLSISCKKQDIILTTSLENTMWKLSKETYFFQNGNVETYNKTSDLDGLFTWHFMGNNQLNILHKPYTYEENANWSLQNDVLNINTIIQGNPDNNVINRFKILKLTETMLKVEFGDMGFESGNGKSIKGEYELVRN